jgi:hypothetical protein
MPQSGLAGCLHTGHLPQLSWIAKFAKTFCIMVAIGKMQMQYLDLENVKFHNLPQKLATKPNFTMFLYKEQ